MASDPPAVVLDGGSAPFDCGPFLPVLAHWLGARNPGFPPKGQTVACLGGFLIASSTLAMSVRKSSPATYGSSLIVANLSDLRGHLALAGHPGAVHKKWDDAGVVIEGKLNLDPHVVNRVSSASGEPAG
jgi:hypothetical protein